jgi:hypothetical protein
MSPFRLPISVELLGMELPELPELDEVELEGWDDELEG